MTEGLEASRLLATGVPGLDIVLRGGLPRGSVHIVEGPPGAGKTILGNQIAYHVAERGARAVYLTLLAESHARLLGHLRSLRFFRPELVGEGVHYASGFKTLESEGLPGLLRLTREILTQHTATLLVLDGLVAALDVPPSARDYRKFVHELQTLASMTGCTVLLLTSPGRVPSFGPELTMVDGILELGDDLDRLRPLRHLRVRKLRGSDPVRGQHTLFIGQQGISVRPRIEAELLRLPEQALLRPSTERAAFGIRVLDRMLHGGVPLRSTTMVLGPSGVGKTLLGLQFLAQGAERGEPGVYFGFYERPATLLVKAERVQIPIQAAQRRGLLELLWEPFGEASIDSLAERLLHSVRTFHPRRLVLDGLQGFQQAVDIVERLGSILSTITEQLELHEVTTLYTSEADQLLGSVVHSPIRGASAVTHNLLLLRRLEQDAQLRRVISILKMRDSGYDQETRELLVTDRGLEIGDTIRPRRPRRSRRTGGSAPFLEVTAGSASRVSGRAGARGAVLIVDDEFGLADLMAEILRDRGYDTEIAPNGELGLSALRERRADLVLLDVMMPVSSGPEMRRRMQEDPALDAIPVILMTAILEAVPADQRDLYAAVLQKPFTPAQLFEAVEGTLAARRGTD
jgi:circadian clock protein KaiC